MSSELLKKAEILGIKVDKRWGEARLQEEIDKVMANATPDGAEIIDSMVVVDSAGPVINIDGEPESVGATIDVGVAVDTNGRVDAMNAYAARLFASQSVDLSRPEKMERIKAGLIEQGWEDCLEGLVVAD